MSNVVAALSLTVALLQPSVNLTGLVTGQPTLTAWNKCVPALWALGMSQLVAIAIITISLDNSSSYLPIFHTIMHLNFPVQLTRHTSLISMLFCSLPLLFILNYLSGNFSTLLAFFLLLYMYYLFHFYILPSTSLLSVFCLTYPIYPENTGQIRLARSLGRPVHIHRNIPVKHWFNIFICLASPLQIWVSRLLPPRSTTRFL